MWSVSETYNLSRSSREGEGARGRQENWGRTLPSGKSVPQTPQWERLGHTGPERRACRWSAESKGQEDRPSERKLGCGSSVRAGHGLWLFIS